MKKRKVIGYSLVILFTALGLYGVFYGEPALGFAWGFVAGNMLADVKSIKE